MDHIAGQVCLTFFYHMFGSDIGMGTLSVICEDTNGNQVVPFTRTGNQGNQWLTAEVGITISSSFKVKIQFNSSLNHLGYVSF